MRGGVAVSAGMGVSRFHSLRTWFLLVVLWLFISWVSLAVLFIEPLGLVSLWIAGWFFVVWTVAVGVRVGLRGWV
jgi:hypothetical protein